MYARANIKYPSNLRELKIISPEQVQVIVEKNLLTLQRSIEILESLTGLRNICGAIIEMQPVVSFPKCIGGKDRKVINTPDEMLKILKAMHISCQRITGMMLMDINRNSKNGRIRYSIIYDDIKPKRRHSLNVYYTPDDRYKVLYSVGQSLRGRSGQRTQAVI